MEANNGNVYSEKIKAGRRVYFIDLKERKEGGCLLVISEKRKNFNQDGTISFQKSRILVPPEDISRFLKAVSNAFSEMKGIMPHYDFTRFERRDKEFLKEREEDLGKKD